MMKLPVAKAIGSREQGRLDDSGFPFRRNGDRCEVLCGGGNLSVDMDMFNYLP